MSPHLGSGLLSKFKSSAYEGHRDLGRICLTYVLLDDFHGNLCETQSEYDERSRQYPFLDYAARCWTAHAEQCPDADDVFDLSMELLASNTFTTNYLNYLQARSRSAIHYDSDKPSLSIFTNARLTWMLKRISTSPPNWYNDELGCHGTPLVNAVFRNDTEMIDFLIDAGADINKPADIYLLYPGAPPLYVAADGLKWEAFDLLLRRGADVNKPHTFSHNIVLHEACKQGRSDKVKQLLERGTDFNSKNLQGLTPLHCAIQGGSLEAVRLLVEAGADILDSAKLRAGTGSGKTAVHYAIELRNEAITEYLLEHCSDLGHLNNLTVEQIYWAEGRPWFARLQQAIGSEGESLRQQGSPTFLTAADVMRARWILQNRLALPPALTALILDYAEYWVRQVERREELWVIDQHTPERPYVCVSVPGWGGSSPVRRVIFRTRSHDQGKSSIKATF